MWLNLQEEVEAEFADFLTIDVTVSLDGNVLALSQEARLEPHYRRYCKHEYLCNGQIRAQYEREDDTSYMRDFIAHLIHKKAERRAEQRTVKRATPAAACIHNGGGCTQAPEPGRKMCRHHLDVIAAAMRASRQKKRAAMVAGAR